MTMVTGQGQNNNQKIVQCTLITDVYMTVPNSLPAVKANTFKGFQIVIDLTSLPPGVMLSQLAQGQQWWCQFITGKWTLSSSIGEFSTAPPVTGVQQIISGNSLIAVVDPEGPATTLTFDGITTVTSTDSSVTITNPMGPSVNLSVPTSTVISPGTSSSVSAVGDTQVPGTGLPYSRQDHVHGREGFSTSFPAVPTIHTGSTGSLTTLSHSDHSHPFWTTPHVSENANPFWGTTGTTDRDIKYGVSSVTTNGSGIASVTYVTPYTTGTDIVLFTNITGSGTNTQTVSIYSGTPPTTTGFTIINSLNGAAFAGSCEFAWLAIGN